MNRGGLKDCDGLNRNMTLKADSISMRQYYRSRIGILADDLYQQPMVLSIIGITRR